MEYTPNVPSAWLRGALTLLLVLSVVGVYGVAVYVDNAWMMYAVIWSIVGGAAMCGVWGTDAASTKVASSDVECGEV